MITHRGCSAPTVPARPPTDSLRQYALLTSFGAAV